MRHRWSRRLATTARYGWRPPRGDLILLYHMIADVESDPYALAVTPAHFAEHLDVVRRYFEPTRLAHVRGDRAAPGRVIVTFDDGYADNLHAARPLLARYDVPATVFVTSGALGSPREYWWDALARVLLAPTTLPSSLALPIGTEPRRWSLGSTATFSAADVQRHRGWRMGGAPPPSARHALCEELYWTLRALERASREAAVQALDDLIGAPPARETHRVLTPDELCDLASDGLIEIGAHTVTHPVLGALSPEAQRAEILGGKQRLEEIVGRPITSFAYPFGGRDDYDATSIAVVRDSGFARACVNVAGRIDGATDPFQLPRLYVRDWDGDELARRLWHWGRS